MTLSHDEIRGLLPEYTGNLIAEDQRQCVEAHLGQCRECSELLVILRGLRDCDLPDPGELFWQTLPQKILTLSRDKAGGVRYARKFPLLRPLPLALAIILIIIAFIVFPIHDQQTVQRDPLFSDPLEYSLLELGNNSVRQIQSYRGVLTAEEVSLLDDVMPSYHSEFVALSSEELSALYKTLRTKDHTGG